MLKSINICIMFISLHIRFIYKNVDFSEIFILPQSSDMFNNKIILEFDPVNHYIL